MEMTPVIYKITNPKGRVYIGQTVDLKTRIKAYKGHRCYSQPRLYGSFNKYGFNNHKLEVVEYCDELDLNNRERHYQDQYDVLSRNGLNCRLTASSDKSGRLSEKTIQKLRDRDVNYMIGNDFRTGIKHSQEIKNQIRNTLIENAKKENYVNSMTGRFGYLNPFFGKKHSKETKEILRRKAGSNIKTLNVLKEYNNDRQHILLNIETGIYYESVREASTFLSINNSTLKAMLSGKFKNNTKLIKV